jgi:hypothetical protein
VPEVMFWFLTLQPHVYYGSSIAVVPYHFPTEANCRAAGDDWKKKSNDNRDIYQCIEIKKP